ncbi:hypothetical protein PN498_01980 [Oscillatoria sp. CS-180]|uniref:DUF6883 domain-containing protein n=1 Tax=Oscillatoria sp. CS-180 TaxID=3021720 RepID=UPI00232EA379|nr:DUF6883 domain-containing protein [Oscillatoria sp. CS-180]MDB9524745.1 hypothetical protein [Oscillatoria sp. CS-180]
MRLRDVVSQIFIDPRKLTAYALDLENPKGSAKAIMFRQYLGFTPANYQSLVAQIEAKALDAEAILGKQDEHGQRYRVDMLTIGVEPDQQEIVRTAWMVRPADDLAKLVTLYIPSRK